MTTLEAYNTTIETINNLKKDGVEVEIQKKYNINKNLENELPSKFWMQVNFINLTEHQADKIIDAAKQLNNLGIQFDAGGFENQRDWELDWSFRYGVKDE